MSYGLSGIQAWAPCGMQGNWVPYPNPWLDRTKRLGQNLRPRMLWPLPFASHDVGFVAPACFMAGEGNVGRPRVRFPTPKPSFPLKPKVSGSLHLVSKSFM